MDFAQARRAACLTAIIGAMEGVTPTAQPASTGERLSRAALWASITAFTLLSLTVVIVIVWNALFNGAIWTGALGYVFDSMQYLAWVREGSDHFLSANLFDTAPLVRDYLNPGLIISSGLHRLGLSIPLAYAFWVPVGIAVVVVAVVKYAGQMLPKGWWRVAAILLALTYKLPIKAILEGHVPKKSLDATTYAGFDAWPVYWSWGFSLTAVAVALLCFGLMRYDAVRSRGIRFSGSLAAIALFCSWLQPWQGATLLGVIIGGEIIGSLVLKGEDSAGLRGRMSLIGTTVLFGMAPLVYYALLGKFDEAWRINGIQANNYVAGASWWTAFAILGPLIVGAAFALRFRPERFRDVAIRLWPVVAIAQLIVIDATQIGNTASHALKGITIPLAILTVIGVAPWFAQAAGSRRFGKLGPALSAAIAVVLIGLLTIPGAINQVRLQLDDMKLEGRGGYAISKDDVRALNYIARSPRKGSVYASSLYGSMVPWRTDRATWVGHETWTPRFQGRSYFNEVALVGGLKSVGKGLTIAQVVRWTGAAFVLQDCYHSNYYLAKALAPITKTRKNFYCATVYEIKPAPKAELPGIDLFHLDWTKRDG
ncbi:MAG: hypothetical protein NTY57_03920 [Solirubrobacterales bacterium]|nr:hypothetical protein [Solirubrobacterales bacterium]